MWGIIANYFSSISVLLRLFTILFQSCPSHLFQNSALTMSLFFSLHEKLPPCQSFVGKEILNESLEDGTLSKILMSPSKGGSVVC